MIPPDAVDAAKRYASGIAAVLGENLRGVYLYGSLARGCFHPATSDLDLLVVVRSAIEDDVASRAIIAHEAMGALPLDALFVTEEQIRGDAAPFRTEFAVRRDAEGRCYPARSTEGKLDLPLIRQDAHDCGVTLLGAPVREVIRPVPWPVLAESLCALSPHLVPRFRNPVLMLCRVSHAFATQSLCSKQQAGGWALTVLPAEWHGLIEKALGKYVDGVPDDAGETPELRAFAEFCAGYVRERGG